MKKYKNALWEIYNLERNLNETTDISAAHPELAKQFEVISKKEHLAACIRDWEFVDPKFVVKD